MKSGAQTAVAQSDRPLARLFSALFGALLGLDLLKFGNPVVLDKLVVQPTDIYEWALAAWPISIGYWLLGAVAVVGLFCLRWQDLKCGWLGLLPLVWWGWQLVSSARTVNAELTAVTLKHFAACVGCFCLGLFVLGRMKNPTLFWLGLACGFAIVLLWGLEQHFGGLEETRKHFWLYVYPTLTEPPTELLKRMSSNRIFSTLFYPNALAGVILLCLPPVLVFVWELKRWFTSEARAFLVGLLGLPALACLFWSGSKGGWLLLLVVGLVALLRLPFGRKWKVVLVVVALALGLAGFAARYTGYFTRGATSVGARFDYWRAALQTARANPFFGTGPGTFAKAYAKIKRPESEMSRLVHNDYLQQASDSGFVGFLAYCASVAGILAATYPKGNAYRDRLNFAVWLGLLGWGLQGLIEFGLYIPALAWTAFALLGWLLGSSRNQMDKGTVGP
jgi:hypothetical protein